MEPASFGILIQRHGKSVNTIRDCCLRARLVIGSRRLPLTLSLSRESSASIKSSQRTLNTDPHGRHPKGRLHPIIRSLTSVRNTAYTTRCHSTQEDSAYSQATI